MADFPKFIIIVFDGLRRDMIRPDIAPNLTRFLIEGADFPLSRSVFPSATRVNASALSAGASPAATGLIANQFFQREVFEDRIVHTGKFAHASRAAEALGGRFLEAKTLGECIAEAGLTMAVVSSGSGGTSYLLHPHAGELGHLRLCFSDWACSVPSEAAASYRTQFGTLPKKAQPNTKLIRLQTDVLLDRVFPEAQPDITVVWFSDPDNTYHHCGIGSPESIEAIRNVDAQFGRILDWRDGQDDVSRYQVFVMSDHGQIEARDKISLRDELAKGGISLGTNFNGQSDFAGTAGYSSVLKVRDGDNGRIAELVAWLQEQTWRGLIFTPNGDGITGGVPGTFDRTLLQIEHHRTPEVYFTLLADDRPNRWDLPGGCTFSSTKLPQGGGTHGGLHIKEMNNLLGVQGELFKSRYISSYPASHTDIAPTILSLLGIDQPTTMTGRCLDEALVAATETPGPIESIEHSVRSGTKTQNLRHWRVGPMLYLDQGWLS